MQAVAGVLLALLSCAAVASGAEPRLVWHLESEDGETLASRAGDAPINPASVVKAATTLWALERLGPQHRFETRFAIRGTLDRASGVLDGDLLVIGGGDPDFHVENAYRVASLLNDAGLRVVRGGLYVDSRFWLGWESGSGGRGPDEPHEVLMAARLRDALDPARWNRATRQVIAEFRERSGIEGEPPCVRVEGEPGVRSPSSGGRVLALHASNPLPALLKRFNAYSNNDIERMGATLGAPDELAGALGRRWTDTPEPIRLETLSGLGTNRLTPRQVVHLLRDLDGTLEQAGLRLEDVLAQSGCDPGTLRHFRKISSLAAGSVVAKTGTLVQTDGGVAVLAGVANTAQGRRFFCVAAPRSGTSLARARSAEERWLIERIEEAGGARPRACGAPVGLSYDAIHVSVPPAAPVDTEEVGPEPR